MSFEEAVHHLIGVRDPAVFPGRLFEKDLDGIEEVLDAAPAGEEPPPTLVDSEVQDARPLYVVREVWTGMFDQRANRGREGVRNLFVREVTKASGRGQSLAV